MSRVQQPEGERGSLKWIQVFIERAPDALVLQGTDRIEWLSPLRSDEFAEYRDAAFLEVLGLGEHADALRAFWPRSGPQWDALGRSGDTVVLVEAKAHLREFFSPGTQAGPTSKAVIDAALAQVKTALAARDVSDWSQLFYQYTNRLAFLWWMRSRGIDARLLFVSFVGDEDMNGPASASEWAVAFTTAEHALGLKGRHALSRYIEHVYPDVRDLI